MDGFLLLRQRLDIEEELERAGLLHSQQELQVDARSRRERRTEVTVMVLL